jgi:hypothetical protein
MIASPWFALLVVSVAAAVASLWWDAGRQARTRGPKRAAAGMVAASVIPLVLLCGVLAVDWTDDVAIGRTSRVPLLLLAMWLPAGLCSRAGSRIWTVLARTLLFFSGVMLLALGGLAELSDTPFHIFDRLMKFPAWESRAVFLGGLFLCMILGFLLNRDGRASQPIRASSQ